METITAIATPPGRGGVGIVRVSGEHAAEIARRIIGHLPKPRAAEYVDFMGDDGEVIDKGLALFFNRPNSFTGEDVLELHGHGGQVVLDMLLAQCIRYGARLARAGEFTERAFLNDKIDLLQAEAVADLIAADSREAARAAMHSLQGDFSSKIHALVEAVIQLRMYVESALDFPEEEIDFLSDGAVAGMLGTIRNDLDSIRNAAVQGRLLKEGMKVVIAGRPNAGKSSLLNCLAQRDVAIVTDIPGTTRDTLREHIQIDGLPLHVIDTAGIRQSDDIIEQEGVKRAHQQIQNCDQLLYVIDSTDSQDIDAQLLAMVPEGTGITLVYNKTDLSGIEPHIEQDEQTRIFLSVKDGGGIDLLKTHLKRCMGFEAGIEGRFIARRRHIEALDKATRHVEDARRCLQETRSGELVAEEMKLAQQALSSITGEFSPDDLLGRIFADFCIGK